MNRKHAVIALSLVVYLNLFFIAGMQWVSAEVALQESDDKQYLWSYVTKGSVNSVAISSDSSYVVAGTQIGNDKGTVYLFNKEGSNIWSHDIDRLVSSVTISSDGKYIAASGLQILPGPAGAYGNGALYFFDRNGKLLWNYKVPDSLAGSASAFTYPIFTTSMSSDGSYIVVPVHNEILFFNKEGDILWEHNFGDSGSVFAVKISSDGSYVVASASGLRGPHGPDYDWGIFFFNREGKMLWNYSGVDGGITSISSLALTPNAEYIVVGAGPSGYSHDLYLFEKDGKLLWKHHVDSSIGPVTISSDGSSIAMSAIGDKPSLMFFKEGNFKWSIIPSASQLAINSDATYIASGTSYGDTTLYIFDRNGNALWKYQTDPVYSLDMAPDGSYLVVGTGSKEGNFGTVYLFNTSHVVPEFPVNLIIMTAIGLIGALIGLRLKDKKVLPR